MPLQSLQTAAAPGEAVVVSKTTHASHRSGATSGVSATGPLATQLARSLLDLPRTGGSLKSIPVQTNYELTTRAAMRIYDIEFDIDSFLDEMEEIQRARRQRQQQIHRGSDVGAGVMETADRDAD
jgi:hypothetical protein